MTRLWIAQALFLLAVVPPLVLVEVLHPETGGVPGEARGRIGRYARSDYSWAAVMVVVLPVLGLLGTASSKWATRHAGLHGTAGHLPSVIEYGAAFIVADLVAYSLHRSLHRYKFLWHFHRVHHRAVRVGFLTGWRFHPVDALIEKIGPPLLVILAGFPPRCVATYLVAAGAVALLSHCDVAVPWPWVQRVIVTPAFHRSHHEIDGQQCNFALVLPVIDIVFRTASFRSGARRFGCGGPEPARSTRNRSGGGQRSTSRPTESDMPLAT